MTLDHSVELVYQGTEDTVELEMNLSICKIYLDVLDRLVDANSAVDSLKNKFYNDAMKRHLIRERIQRFLKDRTQEYIIDQNTDHVRVQWLKSKKGTQVIIIVMMTVITILMILMSKRALLFYAPFSDFIATCRSLFHRMCAAETSKRKLQQITDTVAARKYEIEQELYLVLKPLWEELQDDDGYPYWGDYSIGQ
jgi:hypothetical protein